LWSWKELSRTCKQSSSNLESGPFQVLRGKANGIGSGPKFRMPALEVAA
jgi:hypothetical protein